MTEIRYNLHSAMAAGAEDQEWQGPPGHQSKNRVQPSSAVPAVEDAIKDVQNPPKHAPEIRYNLHSAPAAGHLVKTASWF